MSGKLKAIIIIAAVVVASSIVSFVTVVAVAGNSDKIFPGVTVKGMHLGSLTRAEAAKALDEYGQALAGETVTVKFEGGSGSFPLSDTDFKVNTKNLAEKAWQVGRQGNFLEQWQERKNTAKTPVELPLEYSFDRKKLQVILDNMTKQVRLPAKDARIVINADDTVTVVPSSNGKGVDLETACSDLQGLIDAGLSRNNEIFLKVVELNPKETTDEMTRWRINGLIASFSTRFDAKKTNRVYNIKVAASALDGQIIKPGQVFSFNKVVGPRSQEAGYKLAPTILNNEFVDSLGGGVCQVSTTLYNTLLQADVDVLQRSSHSLTIKYVPLGQDAAVAYGGKDLKFKNNLPCALIIKSAVYGSTITFKLYGDTSLKKTVKIFNNIIKEYPYKIVYKNDPTIPTGKQVVKQKGTKGYRVTSYMLKYKDGKLLARENLPASQYSPLDHLILVGTKGGAARPTGGTTAPNPGQPGDSTGSTGGPNEPGQPGTQDPGGTVQPPPAEEPSTFDPSQPDPVTPPPGTPHEPEL